MRLGFAIPAGCVADPEVTSQKQVLLKQAPGEKPAGLFPVFVQSWNQSEPASDAEHRLHCPDPAL
jgi:hypothetical protein